MLMGESLHDTKDQVTNENSEKSISIDYRAVTYQCIGECQMELEKYSEAVDAFKCAMDLRPTIETQQKIEIAQLHHVIESCSSKRAAFVIMRAGYHLLYAPGGVGYQRAQQHFGQMCVRMSNHKLSPSNEFDSLNN